MRLLPLTLPGRFALLSRRVYPNDLNLNADCSRRSIPFHFFCGYGRCWGARRMILREQLPDFLNERVETIKLVEHFSCQLAHADRAAFHEAALSQSSQRTSVFASLSAME